MRSWPFSGNTGIVLPQRWSFVYLLQVSPSGRFLGVIYGAPPETLDIYDMEKKEVILQKAVSFGGSGCSVGWSSDESQFTICGEGKAIVLTFPRLDVLHEIPMKYPCFSDFSPSGKFLALGSWKQSFIVPMDHMDVFIKERNKKRPTSRSSGLFHNR